MREAGVLLHISSLPGAYGGGTIGASALSFARRLADCGFSLWQVLPIAPVGKGNSPYSSPGAFAGNLFLIDPEGLVGTGLLPAAGLPAWQSDSPYCVDFDFLRRTRVPLLRRVFDGANSVALAAAEDFRRRESFWIDGYAKYQTETEGETPEFWVFAQWIFDVQWQAFKAAVNKMGVRLLGDMPIYVAAESADFAANPGLFLRDDDGRPSPVAGVPPDYFAPRGQLWGNPLYDWDAHIAQDFAWWKARAARALAQFDRVRIDHFRAFSRYYAVPRGAPDAVHGSWHKGPGMALLTPLLREFGAECWLAEDLGEIDDTVRELLTESGLPGMRVLQFAFSGGSDNLHLPHNYPENCTAYTGTHDNNTLLGYLWGADGDERRRALDYLGISGDWGGGGSGAPAVRAALRTLWQSSARTCVAPLQDLLGYGADTRMNTPGVAEGNWGFRVTREQLADADSAWLRGLNERYGRAISPG
ncbi:MAG: 4-alpha-glucanotransferase [Oscillospiraceae bacterium]|jgi:4-alpha-glucanotransferase|nr:4-alpha-glucanotransferase [Oscillospiraceae bacterium]